MIGQGTVRPGLRWGALIAAVSSEEQARLNSTTEAVRGASLTGGAVALLLASVGLFAALSAAPRPQEPNVLLLRGWPAAAGAAGLTVVVASLLGLLLALLTRWASASPRGRRRLRFYAKCCSLVLWAGSVIPLIATVVLNSPTTLAGAVLMIILGLVLYVDSEPGWLDEP